MEYDSNKVNLIKYDSYKIAYNDYYVTGRLATDEFHFISVFPIFIVLSKKNTLRRTSK